MHGLRHAYAQQRYQEITGWKSPAAGGPQSSQLNAENKKTDRLCRYLVIDFALPCAKSTRLRDN